jgi:hypothetical protein
MRPKAKTGKKNNGASLVIENELREVADELRGHVDAAEL